MSLFEFRRGLASLHLKPLQIEVASFLDAETTYVTCRWSAVQLETFGIGSKWNQNPRGCTMPRPKSLIPKLCIDKSRNRAFCKVDGKFIVLGPAGSADTQLAYGKLLKALEDRRGTDAAILAVKKSQSVPVEPQSTLSLNDVFLRFVTEELQKYSKAEQRCIRGAIRIARELFGNSPAADFGPLRLRTVREAMIREGWSRCYINKEVKRLRLILRWGVGWELIPQTIVDSLSAVKSLADGESEAAEPAQRSAVPSENLTTYGALGQHMDAITAGNYSLILVDAHYRMLGGRSENDNAEITQVYNMIDRYAAQTGAAWVLIHHTSKGDQSEKSVTDVGAGAGSQSRAVDTHVVLRTHKEGYCVLHAVTRSSKSPDPVVLRYDYPLWSVNPDADPSQLPIRA